MQDEAQTPTDTSTHHNAPTVSPKPFEPPDTPSKKPKLSRKTVMIMVGVLVLLGLTAYGFWRLGERGAKNIETASKQAGDEMSEAETGTEIEGLQLDPSKNYGDKYSSGVLPVGDEKFSTSAAKKGTVYMCNDNFVPDSQAGAQTRGPWFIGTTQWNVNKKYAVRGSVKWNQNITNKLESGKRVITTNDLPDHVTGTFPVASSDPAYAYDRNPNTIKSQALTYTLTEGPAYSATPKCMGGEVGIILTGVALFNGFDAGGRDAGAWEIQDGCQGHPQGSGIYHYHTLSSCIRDISVGTVIGFALDGFPITGPKVGEKNYLTTDDLDDCHGIVSEITLDGKKTRTYHYVMTQDFPYSASCFRATATQSPGQHSGGQQQSGQHLRATVSLLNRVALCLPRQSKADPERARLLCTKVLLIF
jgi:hypothetical protein